MYALKLFQLKSIEQNELAVMADTQDKATIIFTGVTVIFLPLSFFTSYYGMNLEGISDSSRDEHYFWKVCGTISLIIILFVTLGAFSHRPLTRRIARNRIQPVRSIV